MIPYLNKKEISEGLLNENIKEMEDSIDSDSGDIAVMVENDK